MEHQHTLLVVEDHPSFQHTLRLALQHNHNSIVVAGTGTLALAELKRHQTPFCLILLDATLPDCALPEMLRQLAGLCGLGRVVVMSGHDRAELQARTPIKIPYFLAKPFEFAELYALINLLCPYQIRMRTAGELASWQSHPSRDPAGQEE
jgi:DNA-binding response OmpR family regulator